MDGTRRDGIAVRAGALALRLASMVGGALILKHEVYDTESAELAVIGLGIWLIGVPPALWLDSLRRTLRTIGEGVDQTRGGDK